MSLITAVPRETGQSHSAACWLEKLQDNAAEIWERLTAHGDQLRSKLSGRIVYVLDDALHWLSETPPHSIHAIVTDPP